jgi:hypothetical protein
MFYVLYVLAILCGTVFGLKIHSPSTKVLVNQPVEVNWTRQNDSDPTSVLFLLENLIGGNKTQVEVANSSQSSPHTMTPMNFPDVGTFRMWAVNPVDSNHSYAMSDTFTVMPNNLDTTSSVGVGNQTSKDYDSSAPPPNSSNASPASKMMPLIIGAAIGGFILLLLLTGAVVYIIRRRARASRRTTFHRNRMVKSLALAPPTFAVPRDLEADTPVDEKDGVGRGAQYEYRYGSNSRYVKDEERPPMGAYPFARTA